MNADAPAPPAIRLRREGGGGLTRRHRLRGDLLLRVWREFPDTEGGTRFLELERRGWDTAPRAAPNPDLFRQVIERGENFLAGHPNTDFRREITYLVAVANESWWSIAHSKPDDPIVSGIPYPRRAVNQREAETARGRAITWYREVIRLAPDSPEAASALRRLPRLVLGLDTGQRRFFCTYC